MIIEGAYYEEVCRSSQHVTLLSHESDHPIALVLSRWLYFGSFLQLILQFVLKRRRKSSPIFYGIRSRTTHTLDTNASEHIPPMGPFMVGVLLLGV